MLAAEHDVVAGTADSFDGQDGDVVTALGATLKQALDARDEAVAAVAALGDSDQADYADVLDRRPRSSATSSTASPRRSATTR